MVKLFSNTILSYLETDLNNFINNSNYMIVNMFYNTCICDGELTHNVLLYYIIKATE